MATVKGKTSIKIDDLINDTVVSGHIDPTSGHLLLVTRGGATLDGGNVVKPFGAAWSSFSTYTNGDIVGYAGSIWKAVGTSTNKCPALYTSLWNRLTGESLYDWVERDAYFDSDTITESWQLFWQGGGVVASLDNVAGEFETGLKSLKLDMPGVTYQRIYSKEENIVYGGETIQVVVRARLLSAASGVTITSELFQNGTTGKPEPFESGFAASTAAEGFQTLTTSWATYVFTLTAANAKPRAIAEVLVSATSGPAIVLIDRIKVNKSTGRNVGPLVMFKATRQGGAAIPVGPIPFLGVSFNEGGAAWDGTAYTVPVSGYYELSSQFKNTAATPYATNLGFQKSTDGGTTWTQIAWSPNNTNNAFGGTLIEHTDYFSAGTKLRVISLSGTITPQSDAPAENFFFTARLVSYTGIATLNAVKQSPNVFNVTANLNTSNPLAVLSITVQEGSKVELSGYLTFYATAGGLKHVTATVNGVTTTVGHLYFNEISSHKDIPINAVLGPFPAGTYTVSIAMPDAGGFVDTNDFYNITLKELLPGGWNAPDLTDSGLILVGSAGAAPFASTWANYDASGATWANAGYRKIGSVVYLRGLLFSSTAFVAGSASGLANSTMFILPAGFRPPTGLHITVQNAANAIARINVFADGRVATNYSSAAVAAGSSGWWSIDGLSFTV